MKRKRIIIKVDSNVVKGKFNLKRFAYIIRNDTRYENCDILSEISGLFTPYDVELEKFSFNNCGFIKDDRFENVIKVYGIKGVTLSNCTFENCRFENVFFDEANFRNCSFANCSFATVDIRMCTFNKCKFVNCDGKVKWFDRVTMSKSCVYENTHIDIIDPQEAYPGYYKGKKAFPKYIGE